MTGSASASDSPTSPSKYQDDVEHDDEEYVPYGERPEWSDVEPVRQTPTKHSVLVIDYSPRCMKVLLVIYLT